MEKSKLSLYLTCWVIIVILAICIWMRASGNDRYLAIPIFLVSLLFLTKYCGESGAILNQVDKLYLGIVMLGIVVSLVTVMIYKCVNPVTFMIAIIVFGLIAALMWNGQNTVTIMTYFFAILIALLSGSDIFAILVILAMLLNVNENTTLITLVLLVFLIPFWRDEEVNVPL